MVFVEYENEVEEETARVKGLVEKLRIDAKVVVFWLASGELNTYELIINGNSNDMDWEIIVNEGLRDEEWWDDLQMLRGGFDQRSMSQDRAHLAHIFESTYGRPGVYNPHDETNSDRRWTNTETDLGDIPKRPAISVLSKLGVSAGMHTNHLLYGVVNEDGAESDTQSNPGTSSDSDDFTDDGRMPDLGEDTSDGVGKPLLSSAQPTLSSKGGKQMAEKIKKQRRRRSRAAEGSSGAPSYGTMSTSQTLFDANETKDQDRTDVPRVVEYGASPRDDEERTARPSEGREAFPTLNTDIPTLQPHPSSRARSMSPMRASRAPSDAASTSGLPGRPGMSRHSSAMKFSSRPVPETTITAEGEDSRITFAESGTSTPRERPSASRASSYGHGRFSSRPVPETRTLPGEGGTRTVSFAEPTEYQSPSARNSTAPSQHHSRQSSYTSQGDLNFSVPDLLSSYKFNPAEHEGGSSYSTGSFSLSFNDLPSRAQHLILNELMRRNSTETAVLMSTLPIPSEGTSSDEAGTIRYLSDIEVLCNELPPTLLVLSNNMTVTVSL